MVSSRQFLAQSASGVASSVPGIACVARSARPRLQWPGPSREIICDSLGVPPRANLPLIPTNRHYVS